MTTLTAPPTGTCWSPDCEEPIASIPDRVTYWCLPHDTARRRRIMEAMARLKHDSQGNPRKGADTRCMGLTGKGTRCTRNGKLTASGGYRCKSHLGAERFDRRVA